jgi:PHD/YefM family antitoxin component YafN of YafNO toxin-antitoxin module
MGIQYQTDEQGNRVAVVIPLAEWEAIQERIKEPNEETIAAMEEARHPEKLKSYATPEAMWADLEKTK